MNVLSLRPRLFCAIALSALLIASCGDDSTKPEETIGYPPATTFEQLVKNFRTSYTMMNSEEYEKLLDDSFRFVFDPDDIGVDQPKDWYSRGDELAATERMFGGEPNSKDLVVFSTQIAFVIGEPAVSPANPDWMKVTLSNFSLEVQAVHVDTGETWYLVTSGGYLVDVHGAQVEADPPLWKIMQVVDRPPTAAAGGAAHEETFGSIKASFHPSVMSYPKATTIDQLLTNFRNAIVQMNYREYANLLDPDYEFVFDPDDVGEWNGYAEFWPRLDDLESMRNMFSRQRDVRNRIAQKIRMAYVAGDPIDSDEGDGWKKIILSSFELEVEAIQADNGETWFLRTAGGYFVDIYAKPVGADPAVWKIVRIVDRPPTTAVAGTEDTSLGQIKASFR